MSGDSAGARIFGFSQFEYPWVLGPPAGRYLLREQPEDDPSHVLVIKTLGAPERRVLARRRARKAEPQPEPTPVSTTRITVIDAQPLGERAEAERWLRSRRGDEALDDLVSALAAVNRTLHAHRVAIADGTIREVSLEAALVARVGFGAGEEVAEGRWTDALEVPTENRRRQRRTAALRPQERLAALLARRDRALACEELILRARLDLAAGRPREAALQLRVALEAALAELESFRGMGDLDQRLAELAGDRQAVGDAANAALQGPLSPAQAEDVERIVGRLEATLRARTAAGLPG